jgi:hypothetical protein
LIDCTGTGKTIELIGEGVMLPRAARRMLGGFAVRLTGINGDPEMLRLHVPYALEKMIRSGELPAICRHTVFYPGPGAGEGVCKLPFNPDDLEESARRCADLIVGGLRTSVDSFAGATIVEYSPRVLARDGRRLRGQVVFSADDVLSARKHPSGGVRGWWPIEWWDERTGPSYEFPPIDDYFEIPIASLRSEKIENLLAAGACLSASAEAAASLRASGICLATGDAAGRAAIS